MVGKDIRPDYSQEHQPSMWNAVSTPLGNSLGCHLAKSRDLVGATQRVDDVVRVHAAFKHTLHYLVKWALPLVG